MPKNGILDQKKSQFSNRKFEISSKKHKIDTVVSSKNAKTSIVKSCRWSRVFDNQGQYHDNVLRSS